MIIHVGSTNQTKVSAVQAAVRLYPELFSNPEVRGIELNLDTYGHPKGMKETVRGAIDRAEAAYGGSETSFGIESGLIEVPYALTGYMEAMVCAVFNGTKICLGLAPAFEWPPAVTKLIASGEADGSQAFYRAGLTSEEKIGALPGGAIGMLSNGKIARENQIISGIMMALIQFQNSQYYKRALSD